MMNKILVIGTFLSSIANPLVSAAHTQVIDYPSRTQWSGAYVGVNLGGNWASFSGPITVASIVSNGTVLGPFTQPYNVSTGTLTGGGQLGYNWQSRQIVLGVEAGLNGQKLKASTLLVQAQSPFVINDGFSTENTLQATLLGRIGYARDNWLFYVLGGLGVANVQFNGDFISTTRNNIVFPQSLVSASQTLLGGVGGLGVEYAANAQWHVGLEGRYSDYLTKEYDLGSIAAFSLQSGGFLLVPTTANIRMSTVQVVLKVNYQFDTKRW